MSQWLCFHICPFLKVFKEKYLCYQNKFLFIFKDKGTRSICKCIGQNLRLQNFYIYFSFKWHWARQLIFSKNATDFLRKYETRSKFSKTSCQHFQTKKKNIRILCEFSLLQKSDTIHIADDRRNYDAEKYCCEDACRILSVICKKNLLNS